MMDPSGSFVFILGCWIALAVVLGWLLPKRWQVPAVALCGAGLLATLSLLSLVILGTATVLTFVIARHATRHASIVPIAITLIGAVYLAILGHAGPSASAGLPPWVVPLGMAFYTLRLIHYLIEAGRGSIGPHSLSELLYYHFLPSALPVGPIHRFNDFLKDVRRRRWDAHLVSHGIGRMLVGALKIVIVGAVIIPKGFGLLGMDGPAPPDASYLATLRFWLNLYVMFSGYSDIAIGAAAAMGFHLPENFNYPFVARNIGDFWRRWHISLTAWCRDYVYMPVLARWRIPALAAGLSMAVLGLWHEVSLRYLLWGLYHALGLIVWRRFGRVAGPSIERMPALAKGIWRALATLLTLHFVIFSYPVTNWIQSMVTR